MLSIVIPAYNEEGNINYLSREIRETLSGTGKEFEVIFVDDGSRDNTFGEIERTAREDPRIRGLRLSRNFGHQVALLAGLHESAGEKVVTMDADGQHPASLIPDLISKLEEGYDIVNTIREDTRDAGLFKKSSSGMFYRLFNTLSEVKIQENASDFRIMNREALNAFLSIDEHNRFTRGLVSWMGFRQTSIPFVAPARNSGRSKYTFRRMFRFAFDGLTAFSSKPLRISTYLGLSVLILGIAYSIYALVVFFMGRSNPGWTSLLISILVLGGTQLLILGIIGEYISRIFIESKRRPHYFIEKRTGKGA
jgi:glycosyltransferase involved in cell wall biosynthesis